MTVRLKDIAHDLGVSTVTVSKVLRGNKDVGAKTRALVLERMREVGYEPNMMARGLASGRSYAVGLIVPDLVHPFFGEFARSLAQALRRHNRALLIASSEEDPRLERQEIRALLQRGVDVLLVASCQPRIGSLYEPGARPAPALLIDRDFPNLQANFVGSDDVEVGRLATTHLIGGGRRRIAHIGGQALSPALDRLKGFRSAMQEHGIPVRQGSVVLMEKVEQAGYAGGHAAMQSLLGLKKRPDAVFCYNDLTAIGAMEATLAAGLRIPEDIALIGCGNLPYARHLKVPLSSIDQSTEELGRIAGSLAVQLADRETEEVRTVRLPPRLVERESSRPALSASTRQSS